MAIFVMNAPRGDFGRAVHAAKSQGHNQSGTDEIARRLVAQIRVRPMAAQRRVRVDGSGTGVNSEAAPVTRQRSGSSSLLSSPCIGPSRSSQESWVDKSR